MKTKTRDTSKLQSCMADISKFLSIENGKLLTAFKTDACKYVHLSFDQRIRASSSEVYMMTVIKRKYMSHEGAACLYAENQKHTPFKTLMEKWEESKKKTVCFGKVGFSLESQIDHRCAYGMHFNSSDGWCIRK